MVKFPNVYNLLLGENFKINKKSFKMKILIILIIVENLSCSRFLTPRGKGVKSVENRALEFLQYALDKYNQEQEYGADDLRALIFYINQMNKLKKQYKTPDVYWYSRQG